MRTNLADPTAPSRAGPAPLPHAYSHGDGLRRGLPHRKKLEGPAGTPPPQKLRRAFSRKKKGRQNPEPRARPLAAFRFSGGWGQGLGSPGVASLNSMRFSEPSGERP